MINKNSEYSILLQRYNKILNSSYWNRSKKIRKFLDNFRIQKKAKKRAVVDSYTNLLNEYEDLMNSTFWRITEPLREKDGFDIRESIINEDIYEKWIRENENNLNYENLKLNPLISIIVPVYNTKAKYLDECICSVLNQVYKNYELILINDKSEYEETNDVIKKYSINSKIRIIENEVHIGISDSTNNGIKAAKGDYICFLDHDDLLSKNALYEIAKTINNNRDVEIIYSDEDRIGEDGFKRYDPVFKPDWSPDRLLNDNYICHLVCYKKELVDKTGYFENELDGAQDYDYILRASELTDKNRIFHINKILYHWRAVDGSTALSVYEKPYVFQATKNTKQRVIVRRKYNAYVDETNNIFFNKLDSDKISIIIPSKNNFMLLKRCIDSLLKCIKKIDYEIIVVDNGSDEFSKKEITNYLKEIENTKYIYDVYDFNYSKMCNIGVGHAVGNILLFINDDIEAVNLDFIERMAGFAKLKHIGAIGIKMYYPNSTLIQHCGVVNAFPGPDHCLKKHDDINSYNHNFNRIINNVAAVTGACLMINSNTFKENGWFDEDFNTNFNDVDLCFRLLKKDLYNVVVNDRFVYHHESYSREKEDIKETLFECRTLYNKHPNMFLNDPYYNENFEFGSVNFTI